MPVAQPDVGNDLRAVRPPGTADVALTWPTAAVAPPGSAVFRTDRKQELAEIPLGIGDELLLVTGPATSHVDAGAVAIPGTLLYEVLAADSCGAAVFP